MRNTQLLILLFALVLALAVALVRPLPSRADDGETPPTPDPAPTSTDPVVPQLPVVQTLPPLRKPVAAEHHSVRIPHVPIGAKIVTYAKHLIGVPYEWGGSSPRTGFDCSGLVRYVYEHFGVALGRSSFAQFANGSRVVRGALKPGDLVFFRGLGHVGIYVGAGRFIHAPHSGAQVRLESLANMSSLGYDGARRIFSGVR